MEKEKFEYFDSINNLQSVEISKEDFKFSQKDKKIHDVKIKGKPVTFFKDALKRFVKNKSSVAGGVILGVIILSSLLGPVVMPNFGCFDVSKTHVLSSNGVKSEINLPPKLFEGGTGFYDGTIKKSNIQYDLNNDCPVGYEMRTVSNLKVTEYLQDEPQNFGEGGYIILTYKDTSTSSIADFYSYKYTFDFSYDYTIDYRFLKPFAGNYEESEYRISLVTLTGKDKTYYPLTGNNFVSFNSATDTGAGFVSSLLNKEEEGKTTLNVSSIMANYGIDKLVDGRINIDIKVDKTKNKKSSIFIENLLISSTNEDVNKEVSLRSIVDANSCAIQEKQITEEGKIDKVFNKRFWTGVDGSRATRDIRFARCDFVYDIYEDCYGIKTMRLPAYKVNEWINTGIIEYDPSLGASTDKEELARRFNPLSSKNPIVEIISQEGDPVYNFGDQVYEGYYLNCRVSQYKYLGYPYKPVYLFGTDKYGRDFLKTILTSLRLSLVLAFGCAIINIIIGLVWGSISGYFGGLVDITMERFCDIIGGLPSIAIITLCLLYLKNDMLAFVISMFMTGWMGVAGRTRTQFYRYKGREYVLASRTLGARDGRLIFKHILPNSMGTIITSSILMIPSVIYSEASIAYLGLGLKNQLLFGVILSENSNIFQGYTMYLLIIPTIIMAFILVSFNLFGNGLRDAFNPSLKGGE